MNQSLERVLHFLTGNENIEITSITDFKKLADENTFFPVTNFLLAKKLKDEKHPDYLPQVQKTALYFSNLLWLHFQLTNKNLPDLLQSENTFAAKFKSVVIEKVGANEEEQAETEKISVTEKAADSKEKRYQPEEHISAITGEPRIISSSSLNKAAAKEEVTINSLQNDEVGERSSNTAHTSLDNKLKSALTENNVFDTNFVKPTNVSAEQDEHEIMFQNVKAMLDATSEEAGSDTENAVIPIDPYYTVDYFAAQGIKLEFDQNPKDDLGKHLKKFTQWLKQMKKLGPEDAMEIISRRETEADIQKIADSSNTVREVVTEAMASVLEKQGKKEKAIELYSKLIFLNPDKSAYFAFKINNLKGI